MDGASGACVPLVPYSGFAGAMGWLHQDPGLTNRRYCTSVQSGEQEVGPPWHVVNYRRVLHAWRGLLRRFIRLGMLNGQRRCQGGPIGRAHAGG